MPSRVKGRIYSARDLPVMDLKSNLTDAYVEIKYADLFSEKTEIVYKTLNPVWNKDFRIEIPDDAFLKKYPLEFKVYDYDRVSSNDIIGIILIDLSNLLNNDTQYEVSGWFPIYDTIRGVRGELNLSIKLEYFGNNNPADLQSHVEFFSSRTLFANMRLKDIHGFVEELIVDDDPEYHWKDNFRTSRSSNEARQYLLYKLSGKLRLKIGNKVAEMGGNAVLGYQTFFDFEDNGNIVARAIGTACTLKRVDRIKSKPLGGPGSEDEPRKRRFAALALPADVQCLTLHYAPPPIEIRVGGLVSARSVKVVRASANRNQKMEQQHWDRWWSEIRHEIRNHARSLNCQFVIGYSETVTLNEDMAILTASGTAVNLTVKSKRDVRPTDTNNTNVEEKEGTEASSIRESTRDLSESTATLPNPNAATEKKKQKPCSFCHVPYKPTSSPFPMQLVPCRMCQVKFVPEIMIATIDPPPGIAIVGRGQLIEARVCRTKKKTSGESGAEQVSEMIPFLLYDLHRQLFLKMRLLAHNACFGFTSQIKVAENFIVAIAQATSVRLAALPEPLPLQISNNLRPTQLPNQFEFNDELADSSSRDDSTFSEGSSGEDKSGAGLSSGINTPAIVGSLKTSSVIPAEQSENAIENLLVKMSIQNAKDMENEPIIEAPGIHSQSTTVKDPVHESEEIETNLPPVGFKAEVHDEDVNEGQTIVKPTEEDHHQELMLNSKSVVVEMDDNIDEEMIAVLLEPNYVENFALCNTELLPGVSVEAISNVQYVTMIRQFDWSYARNSPIGPSASSSGLNLAFSSLFRTMYNNVVYKLQGLQSCSLNNLKIDLKAVNDDEIQILLTAMVVIESKKISKQQQDKLKLKDPVPSTQPDDVTTTPSKKDEKSKEKGRKDKKDKEKEKDKDKRRKDKEKDKDLGDTKEKKKGSRDNIAQSSNVERDIFDDDVTMPEPKPEPSPQKKKSDESPRNKQKRTKSNSTLGSTVNSELSDTSSSRKQSQPIKIPPLPPRDEWSSTSSSTVSSTSSSPNNTPRNNMLQQAMLSGNLSPSRASPFNTSMSQLIARDKQQRPIIDTAHIHVTPMSFVPGTQVIKYLGRVELHFIKESFIIREQGGMSSFTHKFLLEVCQIAKSHVHSLGGNCLLSYRIMNVIISEKESKNQGYCLVEVSGDVVFVAPVVTSHKQVLKGFKKLAELSKSTK